MDGNLVFIGCNRQNNSAHFKMNYFFSSQQNLGYWCTKWQRHWRINCAPINDTENHNSKQSFCNILLRKINFHRVPWDVRLTSLVTMKLNANDWQINIDERALIKLNRMNNYAILMYSMDGHEIQCEIQCEIYAHILRWKTNLVYFSKMFCKFSTHFPCINGQIHI